MVNGPAYGSGGEQEFRLRNAHLFSKRTSINLDCVNGLFAGRDLFLDMSRVAEDSDLTVESPRLYTQAAEGVLIHVQAVEHTRLIAERTAFLTTEGTRLTVEGAHLNPPATEGTSIGTLAVEETRSGPKFEFRERWSGKACGMYIAGSKTKIAQMHPLDDNTIDGFLVEVMPNVNCEFVIACFAAVEAMKSVAQKQKELMCLVADITGKFLCGIITSAIAGSIDGV